MHSLPDGIRHLPVEQLIKLMSTYVLSEIQPHPANEVARTEECVDYACAACFSHDQLDDRLS